MKRSFCTIVIFVVLTSCGTEPEKPPVKSMVVTATAYTSSPWETQGDPTQTAFGDTLKPGIKAIAVSRDLIDSGLIHKDWVYIHELEDTFYVLDKMNRRWQQKIDIYFGNNRDSALAWGKQQVQITWEMDSAPEQ